MKLVKENLNEIKHLSGRSKDEVHRGIQELLTTLLKTDDAEELKYYLENIYNSNYKQMLIDIIDLGSPADAADILTVLVDDLDLGNTPTDSFDKKEFMEYRNRVMTAMYRLIVKNKDKIDLGDLL